MQRMASWRSVSSDIKAQKIILRSELETRPGNRIDDKDPLTWWIARHAANCDHGRTPDQQRCGKTWKRPVVEFGKSVQFRPVGENLAMSRGDQRMLRGVYVGNHERYGAAFFSTPDAVKRGRESRECWSMRDGIACSVQHVSEFHGS